MTPFLNCSLDKNLWDKKIYLSNSFLSYLPYLFINEFLGNNFLNLHGHLFDKLIIFLTGVLLAELSTKLSKEKKSNKIIFLDSKLIFIFFLVNPWTYKMFLASWNIIYFINFFLLAILMFLNHKFYIGLFFMIISGLFDYQSYAGMAFLYFVTLSYLKISKNTFCINEYFPSLKNENLFNLKIILLISSPLIVYFFFKSLALLNLELSAGSSLLYRIGITGNDIHNGGILGALQFLGGNRITLCFDNYIRNIDNLSLNQKIEIFNCSLSFFSMFLISLISLIGLFYFQKSNSKYFNLILLPFLFLLLSYCFILQQSSSAHLMGYSYLFGILFSVSLSTLILKVLNKNKFSLSSIIIVLPISLGIILLCIRVSMLTGPYG